MAGVSQLPVWDLDENKDLLPRGLGRPGQTRRPKGSTEAQQERDWMRPTVRTGAVPGEAKWGVPEEHREADHGNHWGTKGFMQDTK